jgi:predicted dehydrogenase
LAPPTAQGAWPGVKTHNLDIVDVEPLRAEIMSFVEAVQKGEPSPISGGDGRRALALALRVLERIGEHTAKVQVESVGVSFT